jgi:Transposase IS116/IS110/IS902 family
VQTAKPQDAQTFDRLPSVPGIGTMLRVVLLDAMHDLTRCPRVQECVSYGRRVTCAKASAGNRDGPSGTTIGHASLPWAFSEAAV